MKSHSFLEYIKVLFPQKGIFCYIGAPIIAYAILTAVISPFNLIFSKGIIMTAIAAPTIVILLDLISELISTRGMASGKWDLVIIKTAPDMKNVLKKAMICDEIRRIGTYFFCYLVSCILIILNGYEVASAILACLTSLFMAYTFTVLSVFILRRVASTAVSAFFVHIISIIEACAIMLCYVPIVFDNMVTFGAVTAAVSLIAAIITGVLCFRSAFKGAAACRYPQREEKEKLS